MLKKEDRANQSQRKRGRRNMARTSVVPGFVHTTMRPFAPFAWPVIFATLSLTVLVEGWSHPYRWGSSQWGFGGNPGVVAKPTKIPLPSGSPVVKIEACTAITAVLLENGNVFAMGRYFGPNPKQLNASNPFTDVFLDISCSSRHLALVSNDSRAFYIGEHLYESNEYENATLHQFDFSSIPHFGAPKQVATGLWISAFVNESGAVATAGIADYSTLGIPGYIPGLFYNPAIVNVPGSVSQLTCSHAACFGLLHDNFTIVAWGRATMGQFLTAETVTLTTPTVIVNDTNRIGGPGTVITSIRASEYIVAVVTSTNNVYKWGYSGTALQYACPATLTTEIAICPVVSGQAKSVKASIYTMLAVLNNDTIVAWGELDAFLLDNSPIFAGSYATSPIIANGHEVSQGGIYELHQAFANSSGLFSWGTNGWGEVGVLTELHRATPSAVPDLPSVTDSIITMCVGAGHSLAISSSGVNANKQVADLSDFYISSWVQVKTSDVGVVAVSCGVSHSLFLNADRQLYIFGSNGRPGVNAFQYDTPTFLHTFTGANASDIELHAGKFFSLVLNKATGIVFGFGINAVQIISTSHSPSTLFSNLTQIDLGGEVQRLAVSENSAVALLRNGTVIGWGWHGQGRACCDQTTPFGTKCQVSSFLPADDRIDDIVSCVQGRLYYCGYGYYTGAAMDAATPTLVYDTETGIVDVGMSRFSLQALQRNGKVLISGSKMQGQTGTNEFSYFSRPATSVVPAHFDWTRIRKVGSSMDYSLFAYPAISMKDELEYEIPANTVGHSFSRAALFVDEVGDADTAFFEGINAANVSVAVNGTSWNGTTINVTVAVGPVASSVKVGGLLEASLRTAKATALSSTVIGKFVAPPKINTSATIVSGSPATIIISGEGFGSNLAELEVTLAPASLACYSFTFKNTSHLECKTSSSSNLAPSTKIYAQVVRRGGSSQVALVSLVQPPAGIVCDLTNAPAGAVCTNNGVVLVPGDVEVTPGTPITLSGEVVVEGSVSVPTGSSLTITQGSHVNISGCFSLNGTIQIDYRNTNALPTNTDIIALLGSAGCVNSVSGQVSIIPPQCQNVTSQPSGVDVDTTTGLTTLSTLFRVDSLPEGECGDSEGVNIPVLASVLAVVVVVVAVLIVVCAVPAARKKVFPFTQRRTEHQKSTQPHDE